MMNFQFLHSEQFLALMISLLIFFTTIFLASRRWIGFSVTVLLLLFSLAAGVIINNQNMLQNYLGHQSPSSTHTNQLEDTQDTFKNQILQAVEDLKIEIQTEKENLRLLANQVKEIFDSMELQKQKLQNFIEETREQLKKEFPANSPPAPINSAR